MSSPVDLPRCRSCMATLRFVVMSTGKRMPCNPVPDRTGNVAAVKAGTEYAGGIVLKKGETAPDGFITFRPHWADCDMEPRTHKGAVRQPAVDTTPTSRPLFG